MLGSNLGKREKWISSAIQQMDSFIGCVDSVSKIYESEPWGFEAEQPFLNQAVKVRSDLGPRSLLVAIQQIEGSLGRTRDTLEYASRTIDIDILTWQNRIFWTRKLQVPHIQLQHRKFALLPLIELIGDGQHPLLKKSYTQLLDDCTDSTWVKPYEPQHV